MNTLHYIVARKVNMIELAQKLGDISEAFRNLGISRQHFYDIKKALEADVYDTMFTHGTIL